jgi:hypothetical protein
VNIFHITVGYQNATVNRHTRKGEPEIGPGKTRGLTGTGTGLARQEAVGRVFGRFWNRNEPLIRSKPGPLVGYPDPLLTLVHDTLIGQISPQALRSAVIGQYNVMMDVS